MGEVLFECQSVCFGVMNHLLVGARGLACVGLYCINVLGCSNAFWHCHLMCTYLMSCILGMVGFAWDFMFSGLCAASYKMILRPARFVLPIWNTCGELMFILVASGAFSPVWSSWVCCHVGMISFSKIQWALCCIVSRPAMCLLSLYACMSVCAIF
jgi:hypothetical protein